MQATAPYQLKKVILVSDEPENNTYEIHKGQFNKEIMDYFYLVMIQQHSKDRKGTNYARLSKKLKEYSGYQQDWDDEGSPAIDSMAIENVSGFLNACDDSLLDGWSLFPTTNGTLSLEKHKDNVNAVFEIGASLMSYSVSNSNLKLMGKEPFSSYSIISTLNKI